MLCNRKTASGLVSNINVIYQRRYLPLQIFVNNQSLKELIKESCIKEVQFLGLRPIAGG